MRTLTAIALGLLAASSMVAQPVAAQSSEDTHAAAARELLTALRAESRVAQLRQALAEQQIQRDKRLSEYRGEINRYMQKYMGWDTMRDEIVEGYKQVFTEAELREILSFFESATGRKALQHMEGVIRDVSRARARVLQENSGELRDAIMQARQSKPPAEKPAEGAQDSGDGTGG